MRTRPRMAQPSTGFLSAAATFKWDPRVSERKQGTEGDDGAAAAKFADDEFSGEPDGTGVLPTTMRTHPYLHFNLYRTLATTASATAGGSEIAAALRRRQTPIATTKLGTSFTRLLRSYPSN